VICLLQRGRAAIVDLIACMAIVCVVGFFFPANPMKD
jgi:hypothetical protein